MIVHGGKPSPFARKVLVTLEEKGISYESKDLIPFPKTPELLAKHPMGKIPILELDDGTYIPDSSVICAYLERIQPEPSIYPKDPVEFAQALFVEEYADTKMAEVIGPVFFESFVKPRVFQQETDTERVKQQMENEVPPVLDYLETRVSAGGATFFERFGIADIGVAAQLANLKLAGQEIDAGRWPKLASYASSMLSRPSFEKALSF